MTIQTSGKFVSLTGNAYERGMQQAAACPEMVPQRPDGPSTSGLRRSEIF